MGYRFGGVRQGTVHRTFKRNGNKSSYGFIRDDAPGTNELFFNDYNGIFEDGDRVVFRARPRPSHPNPLAYNVMGESEFNELVLFGRL